MPKWLSILLKIGVSASLLTWFLYKSDFSGIIDSLKKINPYYYLFIVIFNISILAFAALKWKFLLRENKYHDLLKYNFISVFYSLLLPGQLAGDAVKAYIFGKEKNKSSIVFASVFIDKITGIIGLLLLGILGILVSPLILSPIFEFSFITIVFIGIVLLFSIRINLFFNFFRRLIVRISKFFFRKSNSYITIQNLLDSWREYSKRISLILICILFSVTYQLLNIIMLYLMGNQIGIEISLIDWSWILAVFALAMFIPLSIAGIGIREGALLGLLGSLSITHDKAIALSFLLFSTQIIAGIIGGAIEFQRVYLQKKT